MTLDSAHGREAITDIENLNREEETGVRKKSRHRRKKKSRDRQSEARNRSSHACLPKRTTLTAREGEGRACRDRRQAEWVLESQLKLSLPLTNTASLVEYKRCNSN